jgi:hypothetical protein
MAGLKLTPIILKEINKYLTSPKKVRKFGFDDAPVKTGEDIKRPQKALDREMFKDAEKRFNQANGGRAGYFAGALVQGANVARPFVSPLVRKGAEALTGTAVGKRLSDIFFSKDEGEDTKKEIDPNDPNILKKPDPLDPKNLDDLQTSIEIAEAVDRLKKKEMDITKRDKRTKLARDLDLPVTKSGMVEIRKGDYFNKRLETLKDKNVNFDGYYSIPEVANLLGTKSSSAIQSYIQDKNIPTVKKGLFKVVKLNDFLNVYQGTKKRVDVAPEPDVATKARTDFLREVGGGIYNRFKDMRAPRYLPENVKQVFKKYELGSIEGGHPFPVEFFTKKFGKGNTLQKDRQIDWIYRNKDKLFDKNDLVFQSTEVNKLYRTKIGELKKLYKDLSPLVDKYEGKGPVTNQKDIKTIESLNNKIMDIVAKSEFDAREFIEKSPNSVDLPRFRLGGLHGALFNTDTGEVSLYAPGKEAGFVKGAAGEDKLDSKLKLAGDYLDIINQVITDEGDKKIFTDYVNKQLLPKFQKGGSVNIDLTMPGAFAMGGLSGGDKSGPPPERGPLPQGLQGLMKRGIKI